MEVIMAASLLESSYKDLKKDTQNFIQDEEEPQDLSLWMILKNWQNLPIELKPLPSILKIRFSKKQ
jgi:hypothetical protein